MRQTLTLLVGLLLLIGSPANLLLATDYFVINNEGPTGGDGSQGSPFGTITEALMNAPLNPGDVVNVAAGTYTDENGETFPLNLPVGVTLSGAGAANTLINGLNPPNRVFANGFIIVVQNFTVDESLGISTPTIVNDVTLRADSSSTSPLTSGSDTDLGSFGTWEALVYARPWPAKLEVRNCVLIGAGAQLLGNITIGDGARIGAGSVVVRSVPSGDTAVGVAARLKERQAVTLLHDAS